MTESEQVDYLTVGDLAEIALGILGELQLRDAGLLASAAARPATTVFGEDAYPRFAHKAAALMHSVARNHPLVDGNKRLAWSAVRAFCILNHRDLSYSTDDAEAFVVGVAAGKLELSEIANWIERHLTAE